MQEVKTARVSVVIKGIVVVLTLRIGVGFREVQGLRVRIILIVLGPGAKANVVLKSALGGPFVGGGLSF